MFKTYRRWRLVYADTYCVGTRLSVFLEDGRDLAYRLKLIARDRGVAASAPSGGTLHGLALLEEVAGAPRAGHAERVTDRDRAAVDVEGVEIDLAQQFVVAPARNRIDRSVAHFVAPVIGIGRGAGRVVTRGAGQVVHVVVGRSQRVVDVRLGKRATDGLRSSVQPQRSSGHIGRQFIGQVDAIIIRVTLVQHRGRDRVVARALADSRASIRGHARCIVDGIHSYRHGGDIRIQCTVVGCIGKAVGPVPIGIRGVTKVAVFICCCPNVNVGVVRSCEVDAYGFL